MARFFTDGTSDDLVTDSPPVTTYPFTLACWFYAPLLTAGRSLISIGTAGGNNNRHALGMDSSERIIAISRTTGNGVATTSTSYSADVWSHACGVFTSATSRAAFLNGGGKGTDATNLTPSGVTDLYVGSTMGLGTERTGGAIAHVCVWNIALADAEVALLAARVNPLHIRRSALVGYWPLLGSSPEIDYSGLGAHLTVDGTTIVDHMHLGPLFGWDTALPYAVVVAAGGTVNIVPFMMARARMARN